MYYLCSGLQAVNKYHWQLYLSISLAICLSAKPNCLANRRVSLVSSDAYVNNYKVFASKHTQSTQCTQVQTHTRTHACTHYNKVKPTNNNDLITAGLQLQGDIHNVPDFVQEPAINFSDLVQLINIIAGRIQRRSYCKYVLFSRIVQLLVTHKHTYTKPPYTKDNISTSYLFQRLFPAGLKPNY